MKNFGKIIAVAALAMVSYSASAELAPQWTKGTMVVNATFGAAPTGGNVSLDYVLVDEWWKGHFSVGGEVDFATYENASRDNVNAFGLTPRATYGLNITDRFEVHAVAGFGSVINRWNYTDPATNNKTHEKDWHFYSTELVGCRFFFTENIAVTAEMGYADYMSNVRVGISFKL